MKRKWAWQPIEIEMMTVLHYWEEPWGMPPGGVARETLQPPLEQAFLQELGKRSWRLLGKHWLANKSAFAEVNKLTPDGTAAMARFYARQLLKRLPETVATEQIFWDEYMLNLLGMDAQEREQDETAIAYLKTRMGKPGWEDFLKRAAKVLNGKANSESVHLSLYGLLWDLYPMPLRFWADSAAADFLSGVSNGFNLDKVRNTRRELGLVRNSPTIVLSFRRRPAPTPGEIGFARVKFDDVAAKKCGLSAMLSAFCEYLKGDGKLGS